jgi:hypothetical protein
MAIKLNTGKIAFPITFDNGETVKIYFNPNDPELAIRFEKLSSNIVEKIAKFGDVELNANGTPVNVDNVGKVDEFQKILKDELDVAFGGKVSDVVFKYCSPLAIVDGDYFVNNFIQAITPEVEKEIKKTNTEMAKKMEQHLAKYAK